MNSLKVLAAIVCGAIIVTSAWAQTGEVYSLNVVGFQKVTVQDATKPYVMSATPFTATNANINQVVGPQLTGGTTYDNSDNILVWVSTNQRYKKYFLYTEITAPPQYTNLSHKWADYDNPLVVATNADITPGMGIWLRSHQALTQMVVFAGDVVDSPAVTSSVIPGYQIMAYPYSTTIGINDMAVRTQGYGGTTYDNSDNILVWVSTNQRYKKYFLYTEITAPPQYTNLSHKWADYDNALVVATSSIRAGESFWYRHRGSGFNWAETKPYTVP